MRKHLLLGCTFGAALAAAPLATLPLGASAQAAMLRPFTQIKAGTVRLADLFDDLGGTPDRVLGHAPAPGARIIVGSPQLAAIARDFNVDWRPQTGAEQAVLERSGEMMPAVSVLAPLHQALAEAGAPQDFDVSAPAIAPILLPVGSHAEPQITQLSYDAQAASGRGAAFSALMTISVPDVEPIQIRVSGQVVPMVTTATAGHRLTPGQVVQDGDLRLTRVRAGLLHGATGISPEAAIGLALRHDVQAGQVLTTADLVRPALVQRGALVRMSLVSEGLQLSAQGVAREPGGRGETIHVENPLSHLVVMAEVTGPGEVRVAPRADAVSLVSAP
jgi:flagella basal body P-ring formation protein FlgA